MAESSRSSQVNPSKVSHAHGILGEARNEKTQRAATSPKVRFEAPANHLQTAADKATSTLAMNIYEVERQKAEVADKDALIAQLNQEYREREERIQLQYQQDASEKASRHEKVVAKLQHDHDIKLAEQVALNDNLEARVVMIQGEKRELEGELQALKLGPTGEQEPCSEMDHSQLDHHTSV